MDRRSNDGLRTRRSLHRMTSSLICQKFKEKKQKRVMAQIPMNGGGGGGCQDRTKSGVRTAYAVLCGYQRKASRRASAGHSDHHAGPSRGTRGQCTKDRKKGAKKETLQR